MKRRRRTRSYRCLVLCAATIPSFACARLFGVQSDDGDVASTFATAMVYDSLIERIYITGSSYGGFFDSPYSRRSKLGDRDCFLTSLQLPTEIDDRGPTWLLKKEYGKRSLPAACNDVHVYQSYNGRAYYLAGHSYGSAGMFETLDNRTMASNFTSANAKQTERLSGMIIDSSVSSRMEGSFPFRASAVQIPLSISSPMDGSDDVIVASTYSSDSSMTASYSAWMDNQHTLQPDPDIRKALFLSPMLNSSYSVFVQRLSPIGTSAQREADMQQTLRPLWETHLEPNKNENLVVVTSVHILSNETMLVSGYYTHHSASTTESFVKGINGQTGKEINSISLKTAFGDNSRAYCICGANGSGYAYIVGNSDSESDSSKAFVIKLDAQSLSIIWKKEVRSIPASKSKQTTSRIYGLGCAVQPNDKNVYLAGTMANGSVIFADGASNSTSSAGGDDIFTVKLDTVNGDIVWMTQTGTTNNDALATGRGIVLDKNDNILLLGNTKGSFMRKKSSLGKGITNDIVIFSVDKTDGKHLPIKDLLTTRAVEQQADEGVSKSNTVTETESTDASSFQSALRKKVDELRPISDGALWSYPTASPSSTDSDETLSSSTLLVAVIVVANLLLASFGGLFCLRRQKRAEQRYARQPMTCFIDDKSLEYPVKMEPAYFFPNCSLTMTRANDNQSLHTQPLIFDPELVTYSCESDASAFQGEDTGPSADATGVFRSEEETEAEVMRLLHEWKREKGHPKDLSGIYA